MRTIGLQIELMAMLHDAKAAGFIRKGAGGVTILSGSAAAWLVWEHRRQFHRTGVLDFKIPKEKKDPPWFKAALGAFESKPDRWKIERLTTQWERIYRITWRQWMTRSRGT
jgi:hypothetical protein